MLIFAGEVAGQFWYVSTALAICSYVFWFSKKSRRLLWFNAALCIIVPLLFGTMTAISMAQIKALIDTSPDSAPITRRLPRVW
jgi:hypothetical protein